MPRWFNTAGPCRPDKHYMLPPLVRLPKVSRLIDQESYVESLTLRNFNEPEVAELYQQHTTDTGQIFEPEAIELAFDLTQGQPWLVNLHGVFLILFMFFFHSMPLKSTILLIFKVSPSTHLKLMLWQSGCDAP
jgi:hypothetical protein